MKRISLNEGRTERVSIVKKEATMLRCIVFLLIVCRAGNCLQTEKVNASVAVMAETGQKGEHLLRMTITNGGRSPLIISNGHVPWKRGYYLILAAEGTQALSDPIEKLYPIEDPEPGNVILDPGQSSSGLVRLDKRFRYLSRAAAKQDVIVFWSYQIVTVDNEKSQRFGGWVLIPKAGSRASPPQ